MSDAEKLQFARFLEALSSLLRMCTGLYIATSTQNIYSLPKKTLRKVSLKIRRIPCMIFLVCKVFNLFDYAILNKKKESEHF